MRVASSARTVKTPSPATRPAAQAGRFYPASPPSLARLVERFTSEARPGRSLSPKAVIAPHAGYTYSGPIAGSAFAPWLPDADRIRRVVLLGPSHWVSFPGLALPDVSALATPLGEVPVDLDAVRSLAAHPQVRVFSSAHEREHCLEVELPFLQVLLRDFAILPLVVGSASDEEVREVVDALWGGDETRFVISSDLSHYLGYDAARRLDRTTAGAIEESRPDVLTGDHACGYRPVRGFLAAAAGHGLTAETVDLRNSGDTAGPRDEVVGYGAFLFAPLAVGSG